MSQRFWNRAILFLTTCWLIILSGCPCDETKIDIDFQVPLLERPLGDPNSAEIPIQIIGSFWLESSNDNNDPFPQFEDADDPDPSGTVFYHVAAAGKKFPSGFIRILEVLTARGTDERMVTNNYIGFVVEINEVCYLHLPMLNNKEGDLTPIRRKDGWAPKNVIGYFLVPFETEQDGSIFVHMTFIDKDFIDELAVKDRLKIETKSIVDSDYQVIVASEKTMREQFSKHQKQLFLGLTEQGYQPERFRRIQTLKR